MFAFIDSPIQLMVLMIVILIIFGPQKLPEIGQQIGRALRDLRKATHEFTNVVNLDDHSNNYSSNYDPPRYDSYGNMHEDANRASIPEEDVWEPPTPETKAISALSSSEPPRGDFAAAALSDASTDYGVGLSAQSSTPEQTSGTPAPGGNYPEGTVPRSNNP